MKKIIPLLMLLIMLTGCNNKKQVDIVYDTTYYQVYKPYKKAVGSYSIRSYDKQEVETMLMNLSTNYFKTNNSFYQEGQYLTSEELKELITEYNKIDPIKIDNATINPSYITSIYEQDYLLYNGHLKGISLAIVVDNKQYYNDISYKIVDENIVLDYAKEKAKDLVNYLKNKEQLKNIRIVIGIYLQSNDYLKGSFKYIGEVDNLNYVNYNYQALDSSYIMSHDMNAYNTVLAIKQSLNDYNTLYLNPIGLYKGNTLVKVDLNINKSYLTAGEILTLSSMIGNNLDSFGDVEVNVYFKSNNTLKGYVVKKQSKIETFILED